MSKSLGNFVTIDDSLDHWGGGVLRLNMLKTNYRQPIDWTQQSLKEAGRELSKWSEQLLSVDVSSAEIDNRVVLALLDDLNTAEAIAELRRLHKTGDLATLSASLEFLGISLNVNDIQGRKHKRLYAETGHYSMELGHAQSAQKERELIEFKVSSRLEARKAKNWAESDRIRGELTDMGIAIMDNKDGTTSWEVKR